MTLPNDNPASNGHASFAAPTGSAAEELQPLVKELRKLSEGWRNSPSDPHNIANAVMVALLEVSNAIIRAYGEPPYQPVQCTVLRAATDGIVGGSE